MGLHPLSISFCQFSYVIIQAWGLEEGRSEGRDREKETERKNSFYKCQDLGTPAFHSMSMNLSVSLNLMFSSESQILYCSVAHLCLTLPPYGLRHTRLSGLSPSPGACSR